MQSQPYLPPESVPFDRQRPTWVEVDLEAIAANMQEIRGRSGPHRYIMVMVKADAYGHGAVPVAQTCLHHGADWLGVALPEEGWRLRQSGIRDPILVLGPVLPSQVPLVMEADLAVALFSFDLAESLDAHAARFGRKPAVHIKVDTGMGRIGVPAEQALDFLKALRSYQNLELQGIYTHFATADSSDKTFTHLQMTRFFELVSKAAREGIAIPLVHCSNSAALLDLPETFLDLVRPGIIVYGIYPSEAVNKPFVLRSAMTWKTRIAYIKDLHPGESVSYGRTFVAQKSMRVATLPVGYADGLSRHLSNRGEVLVHGRKARICGVVCMDMTMIDVTQIPEATTGDEVVLFGSQDGAVLPVEEMARSMESIPYEVICNVGKRVPRRYLPAAESRESTHVQG